MLPASAAAPTPSVIRPPVHMPLRPSREQPTAGQADAGEHRHAAEGGEGDAGGQLATRGGVGLQLEVPLAGVGEQVRHLHLVGRPRNAASRVRSMTGRSGLTQRAQGVVQMTWSSA